MEVLNLNASELLIQQTYHFESQVISLVTIISVLVFSSCTECIEKIVVFFSSLAILLALHELIKPMFKKPMKVPELEEKQ